MQLHFLLPGSRQVTGQRVHLPPCIGASAGRLVYTRGQPFPGSGETEPSREGSCLSGLSVPPSDLRTGRRHLLQAGPGSPGPLPAISGLLSTSPQLLSFASGRRPSPSGRRPSPAMGECRPFAQLLLQEDSMTREQQLPPSLHLLSVPQPLLQFLANFSNANKTKRSLCIV